MEERYEDEFQQPETGRPVKRGGVKIGIVIGALAVLAVEALILGGIGLLSGRVTGLSSMPGGSVLNGGASETSPAGEETNAGSSDIMSEGEGEFNRALESKLSEINTYIDDCFIFDVDSRQMLDYAVKGYVSGLGDIYSQYMTPEEFQTTMEESDGGYVGIGVAVQQDAKTNAITVMTVYPDSPAAAAGMMEGDVLAKVDGEDISGADLSDVVNRIRGTEGTAVVVSVYRDGEILDLNMVRKALDKLTVETKMLDSGIGYLKLTEFDAVSVDQIRDGVAELKAQGMTKMILDLRNNPGGLLTSVVTIADDFLPEANVFYFEDKQGKRTTYDSADGMIWEGDMAVLINENSASAAEVLSGTLKDNDRAVILGTQSFGKGIVQTFYPLSDGSCVKLTSSHYFTPNGTDIHGVGITPDQVVEDDEETEADEQLDAAIGALNGTPSSDGQAAMR